MDAVCLPSVTLYFPIPLAVITLKGSKCDASADGFKPGLLLKGHHLSGPYLGRMRAGMHVNDPRICPRHFFS